MPKGKRQFVLTRPPIKKGEATVEPLGSKREVLTALARFNTAPDGGKKNTGMDVLWGPGMVVEFPSGADPVNQAMATVNEEDIALPVLLRVCRELNWQVVDLETGRSFGGPRE